MKDVNRRTLLTGVSAVGMLATAGAAKSVAMVKSEIPKAPIAAPAPAPPLSVVQRLKALVKPNLHPIDYRNGQFTGAGWEMLVHEGQSAEFFLIGEEHGMAETPKLAAALFAALQPAGYNRLAIEISAPIAQDLDQAARHGIGGIVDFIRRYPPGPAFYNWQSEAELLVAVRALVPADQPALWGLDYEVLVDRRLIERLLAKAPPSAMPALKLLDNASKNAWAKWHKGHDISDLFMFAGDPALVYAVRDTWPNPDADACILLDVLAETLEINALQQTTGWGSNSRRAALNRKTLVRLLNEAHPGKPPKVMMKMGSTHMMRGVSWTGIFDIGSLAAEAAALRSGHSFHLVVGGGRGAEHGTTNPADLTLLTEKCDMYDPEFGLGFLLDEMPTTGLALLDLRPMRRIASWRERLAELNNSEAVRVIHGYDMMLVWNGSAANTMLRP